MTSRMLFTLAAISMVLAGAAAEAQDQLAAYRFNTGPHLNVTSNAAGLAASPVSLSSGSFGISETNVITGTDFPDEPFIEESGWTASSPAAAKAFLLTLTPDAGQTLTVTGLSFNALAVGSGPSAISYDVGGVATGTINATNAVLISTNFLITGVTSQISPILIKIQGWTNGTRSTAGTGAFRLDDVVVYGLVQAIPTNLQFQGAAASVSELSGSYTITVTKTVSSGDVTGEILLGGSATLGVDYTVDTTNLVLSGATTSATVVVTVTDEASVEGPETVTLALTNVVGGGVADPSTFTLTIDDPTVLAVYRFNTEPYLPPTTNAAGLTASIVSLSSGTIETNQTSTASGAGFPDVPYIQESGGWTASSATNAKNFRLTLTPDAGKSITVTGVEFKAHASSAGPSAFSCAVAGMAAGTVDAPDQVLLTNKFAVTGVTNQTGAILVQIQGWTNNSRVTSGSGIFKLDDVLVYGVVLAIPTNLQFQGSAGAVEESSTSFTVTVTKTVSSGDVTGQIQLGGTATPGVDYTIDTTNLVLNGATTAATVVVTVTDDASLEGPETVTLALTNVVGGGVVAPSTFTLTIDDPSVLAVYRFNTEPYLPPTTNAAGLTASIVSLSSGTIETNQTSTINGAGFPDVPYIQESGGWTSAVQTNSKNFRLTLTPDAGKSITVTGLEFKAYASAAGPSAFSYDVAGLAMGTVDAPDQVLLTNKFAITGVANQTGAILVQLQGWTNSSRVTSGSGIFKLDDVLVYGYVQSTGVGAPTNVQFASSGSTVGEEAGAVTVTVFKTEASGSVTAEIQLSGSAALATDYTVNTTNIVLSGASTSQTVVVTITDDPDMESTETVVMTLVNVSGGTLVSPSVFTLSITNNDVADADGDLMPDAWEQDNFGGSTTNEAAGDHDGDGYSNLDEYIAGTHPTNGTAFLRLSGLIRTPTSMVTFVGVTGRAYRVDYSENLLNGAGWVELPTEVTGTNGLMLIPDPAVTNSRDYRLRVRLP